MSNYKQAPEGKDPELWKIARKRAGFKSHAVVYLIINVFLWLMWYFKGDVFDGNGLMLKSSPIFTTIGWGLGLAFHYASAYIIKGRNMVDTEYEKLKNKQL